MTIRSTLLVFCVCLTAAVPARAWGPEGHKLIARFAYEWLTPEARERVDALIAADAANRVEPCPVASIEDAAVWADCVRAVQSYDWMKPLHFDDVPLFGEADRAAYCKGDKCASAAIEAALHVLADESAREEDRLLALYQIVHFAGDIHQPLHASDNGDAGGNGVKVIYLGESERYDEFKKAMVPYNLHFVWDTALVAQAMSAREDAEGEIRGLADANRREWSNGNVEDWVTDSHDIAVRYAYGWLDGAIEPGHAPKEPVALDETYVAQAAPIAREQLAKGALRLSLLLNAALSGP